MSNPTKARTSLPSIDDITENFFNRLDSYLRENEYNKNNIESIRGILINLIEAVHPLRIEMWKLREQKKESEASFKLIAYNQLFQRCQTLMDIMDSSEKPLGYDENDFLSGILALKPSVLKPKQQNIIRITEAT